MKHHQIKHAICGAVCIAGTVCAFGALPSLGNLSDSLANLQDRFSAITNRISALESRLNASTNTLSHMRQLIESNQQLRERYHGGMIGQYKVDVGVRTNNMGRIIKNIVNVHLYADGSCYTNGSVMAKMILDKGDPEAAAKAMKEIRRREEEIRAAWERANLPPDLAAIREAQRQAATTQTVTVVIEGN